MLRGVRRRNGGNNGYFISLHEPHSTKIIPSVVILSRSSPLIVVLGRGSSARLDRMYLSLYSGFNRIAETSNSSPLY
jgi:hypothetical protein